MECTSHKLAVMIESLDCSTGKEWWNGILMTLQNQFRKLVVDLCMMSVGSVIVFNKIYHVLHSNVVMG